MDVDAINRHLFRGEIDEPGVFPHLDLLASSPFVFEVDFGLGPLPEEPGILLVRGARQYGKSTWLEARLRETVERFGPGSAFYLNGDEMVHSGSLVEAIRHLTPQFRADANVRRLFIDEITAVPDWERAIKRLVDAGELRRVLVVTTGSKATDLRRGGERLPGRKGRLARTTWLFTPLPYREFDRVCRGALGDGLLDAYLLSGGCPAAAAELAAGGRLPEHIVETVRDWMLGECALAGRGRASLLAVLSALAVRGGAAIGQTRLAREAGLANNTVAAGYIELLTDLGCVGVQQAWDPSRQVALARRPAKFPFVNLLAAVAWNAARLRSARDFHSVPPEEQGRWCEWLVAQEVWRRAAIRGDDQPERLLYWSSGDRELDFVVARERFIEVKRGRTSPLDFGWFPRVFPRGDLLVVGRDSFRTDRIRGLTLEELLLDEEW